MTRIVHTAPGGRAGMVVMRVDAVALAAVGGYLLVAGLHRAEVDPSSGLLAVLSLPFLLPAAGLWALARVRLVVEPTRLRVVSLFGSREVSLDDVLAIRTQESPLTAKTANILVLETTNESIKIPARAAVLEALREALPHIRPEVGDIEPHTPSRERAILATGIDGLVLVPLLWCGVAATALSEPWPWAGFRSALLVCLGGWSLYHIVLPMFLRGTVGERLSGLRRTRETARRSLSRLWRKLVRPWRRKRPVDMEQDFEVRTGSVSMLTLIATRPGRWLGPIFLVSVLLNAFTIAGGAWKLQEPLPGALPPPEPFEAVDVPTELLPAGAVSMILPAWLFRVDDCWRYDEQRTRCRTDVTDLTIDPLEFDLASWLALGSGGGFARDHAAWKLRSVGLHTPPWKVVSWMVQGVLYNVVVLPGPPPVRCWIIERSADLGLLAWDVSSVSDHAKGWMNVEVLLWDGHYWTSADLRCRDEETIRAFLSTFAVTETR